jgi:hypothetical protein
MSRSGVWLVVAVVGAGATVLVVERRAIVASFESAPVRVEPAPAGEMTALERAEGLRNQAAAACDLELWAVATTRLDEANKLDPASETSPRVQAMRRRITASTTRAARTPGDAKTP